MQNPAPSIIHPLASEAQFRINQQPIYIRPYIIILPLLGTTAMVAISSTAGVYASIYIVSVVWPQVALMSVEAALEQIGIALLQSGLLVGFMGLASSAIHMQLQQICQSQQMLRIHYQTYPIAGTIGLISSYALSCVLSTSALPISTLAISGLSGGVSLICLFYLTQIIIGNKLLSKDDLKTGRYLMGKEWVYNFATDCIYGMGVGILGAKSVPLAVTALELWLGITLHPAANIVAHIIISYSLALIVEPPFMKLRDVIAENICGWQLAPAM